MGPYGTEASHYGPMKNFGGGGGSRNFGKLKTAEQKTFASN